MNEMVMLLTIAVSIGQVDKTALGKKPGASGKVAAVSADGKLLTLEQPSKKGGEPIRIDIKLTGKTQITYFGVEKGADQPRVGYLARVLLEEDAKDTAKSVDFGNKEASLTGRVVDVAADGKQVTLEVFRKGEPPTRVELKLTDRTRLGYSGVEKNGEKPTPGYGAVVWLKEGSKDTAAEIQFTLKNKSAKDGKVPSLSGKVTAISADGKELTLELPTKVKGEADKQVVIRLTDKTKLEYAGIEKDAAKPTIGFAAMVILAEGTKDMAASVTFLGKKGVEIKKGAEKTPDLKGVLSAISNDGKTLTFEVPPKVKGGEALKVEITLTANTKLSYQGFDKSGDAQKPTIGTAAAIWLAEGTKSTAAGVQFFKKSK